VITEMLAYFVWILLMVGAVAFVFRILRLDQPRPVRIPVRREDKR
jgi:hypothetical protein